MTTPDNSLTERTRHDTRQAATCNLQVRRPSLGALACDAWHHYYHYQASAQYLWLAETLRALGRTEKAAIAYEKSLFQDHGNESAKEGMTGKKKPAEIPDYANHPAKDAVFCIRVGQEATAATSLHDAAVEAMDANHLPEALLHLKAAIILDPAHSNSHFALGKCQFLFGHYEAAQKDFAEAILLSHRDHDAYHRAASALHIQRGQQFAAASQTDLAIADFSKALDLYRNNNEALAARAKAYRAKGNILLAVADERRLQGD